VDVSSHQRAWLSRTLLSFSPTPRVLSASKKKSNDKCRFYLMWRLLRTLHLLLGTSPQFHNNKQRNAFQIATLTKVCKAGSEQAHSTNEQRRQTPRSTFHITIVVVITAAAATTYMPLDFLHIYIMFN